MLPLLFKSVVSISLFIDLRLSVSYLSLKKRKSDTNMRIGAGECLKTISLQENTDKNCMNDGEVEIKTARHSFWQLT